MEELEKLINELSKLDNNGAKDFQSWERNHNLTKKFEKLLQNWIKDCKSGKVPPIDKISNLIEGEITYRLNLGELIRPKKLNPLAIFYIFKNRLQYLKFEIEKINQKTTNDKCDCLLRLSLGIYPNMENLERYGTAIQLNIRGNYRIDQCKKCKTKWMNYIPGWGKWNPKEYPLKD